MNNAKEFRVFSFTVFVGVFVCVVAAQNVTDLVNGTEAFNRNSENSQKSPLLTRLKLTGSYLKNNLNRFISTNHTDNQATLRNISRSEESSEAENSSLNSINRDEFRGWINSSTPSAPDTSQNKDDVENGTEELLVHPNQTEDFLLVSDPSPSQSSVSGDTSEKTVKTTDSSSQFLRPSTTQVLPISGSVLQRSFEWMKNRNTLNILVPVAAGCLFFSVVIITVAMTNCIKQRCCRRKRSKCLPDSLVNLKPAELEQLLAESSEDEFWVTTGPKSIKKS